MELLLSQNLNPSNLRPVVLDELMCDSSALARQVGAQLALAIVLFLDDSASKQHMIIFFYC